MKEMRGSQVFTRVKMPLLVLNNELDESRQAKQTFDLCRVVDKQHTGRVAINNFLRIA